MGHNKAIIVQEKNPSMNIFIRDCENVYCLTVKERYKDNALPPPIISRTPRL